MKSFSQLALGVITAAGSSLMVLAAILLSLAEGSTVTTPTPSQVANVVTPLTILSPNQTIFPTVTVNGVIVVTATDMPPMQCPTPPGWSAYTLVSGDTLEALAARSAITIEQIREANCLLSSTLLPGTILYLPPSVPSPTDQAQPSSTPWPTPTPCIPPPGWIRYQIHPNETLTRISLAFGVSVDQLMVANCMTSSLIMSGSYIHVPNVPTRTPVQAATPTPTDTPSIEPTFTLQPITQEPPTATLTETLTVTPTETLTETPTETLAPTSTETLVPTETPTVVTPSPTVEQPSPTPGTGFLGPGRFVM